MFSNLITGKMHDLPVEKALLYWIPSILVAIGMFITLLCSFWKFHKRKMFIRQLQLDYMEVNLEVKRPRIGAIRCNTHGAKWDDLMASLSLNNNFPASFRQLGHIKSLKQYGKSVLTIFIQNTLTNYSLASSFKINKDK